MPVKARRPKRRVTEAAELADWQDVFQTGYDFFDDLGWSHKEQTPEFRAAVKEAWRRLGSRFMETWQATETQEKPWALQEFGRPKCQ